MPAAWVEVRDIDGALRRVEGWCDASRQELAITLADPEADDAPTIGIHLGQEGVRYQIASARWAGETLELWAFGADISASPSARFVWTVAQQRGRWTFESITPLDLAPADVAAGLPGWKESGCPDH